MLFIFGALRNCNAVGLWSCYVSFEPGMEILMLFGFFTVGLAALPLGEVRSDAFHGPQPRMDAAGSPPGGVSTFTMVDPRKGNMLRNISSVALAAFLATACATTPDIQRGPDPKAPPPNAVKALPLISVGQHTDCAARDGDIRCWGSGPALGHRDSSYHRRPLPVIGLPSGVQYRALSVNRYGACVVTTKGVLWCWGRGPWSAASKTVNTAREVTAFGLVSQVQVTRVGTCVIGDDRLVHCWGRGAKGQVVTVAALGETRAIYPAGPTTICAVGVHGRERCFHSGEPSKLFEFNSYLGTVDVSFAGKRTRLNCRANGGLSCHRWRSKDGRTVLTASDSYICGLDNGRVSCVGVETPNPVEERTRKWFKENTQNPLVLKELPGLHDHRFTVLGRRGSSVCAVPKDPAGDLACWSEGMVVPSLLRWPSRKKLAAQLRQEDIERGQIRGKLGGDLLAALAFIVDGTDSQSILNHHNDALAAVRLRELPVDEALSALSWDELGTALRTLAWTGRCTLVARLFEERLAAAPNRPESFDDGLALLANVCAAKLSRNVAAKLLRVGKKRAKLFVAKPQETMPYTLVYWLVDVSHLIERSASKKVAAEWLHKNALLAGRRLLRERYNIVTELTRLGAADKALAIATTLFEELRTDVPSDWFRDARFLTVVTQGAPKKWQQSLWRLIQDRLRRDGGAAQLGMMAMTMARLGRKRDARRLYKRARRALTRKADDPWPVVGAAVSVGETRFALEFIAAHWTSKDARRSPRSHLHPPSRVLAALVRALPMDADGDAVVHKLLEDTGNGGLLFTTVVETKRCNMALKLLEAGANTEEEMDLLHLHCPDQAAHATDVLRSTPGAESAVVVGLSLRGDHAAALRVAMRGAGAIEQMRLFARVAWDWLDAGSPVTEPLKHLLGEIVAPYTKPRWVRYIELLED